MVATAILAINPGTTTTRCALYAVSATGISLIREQTLEHPDTEMAKFSGIPDQLKFRAACVSDFLSVHIGKHQLIACVGRGGMLTPVPPGVIAVNDALVEFALHTPVYNHASNLGAPLADAIAKPLNIPAFIVDPVSVDELSPVARISGFDEITRFSFVHALNIRACARKFASDLDKSFEEIRVVVAHLGAGFSIATLLDGKLVDSSNRMEISPFTPERAGGLPPLPLIELCYSGKYDKSELLKKLYGSGGLYSYLGTKDVRLVEAMIEDGDAKATLIYDAMLYQVGKAIGAMASVANFDLDAVILTGGLANSTRVVSAVTQKTVKIAPLIIYPGSNECLALAEGANRVLEGAQKALNWPVASSSKVLNQC